MKKLNLYFSRLLEKFWFSFSVVVFLGALAIKAMYSMDDFPYFQKNGIWDLVLTAAMIALLLAVFRKKEIIEKKLNYMFLFLFFGGLGCLFLFLVPLRPFSDMQYVAEGALQIAAGNVDGILQSDYLQMITKNLKVSLFYACFAVCLPKNVISLRMINVLLYLVISFFMGKIGKNLNHNYPKMIFLLTASYLPLFLYCNHIYFDLPVLCVCVVSVYFYTSGRDWKQMVPSAVFLGIGISMRELAYVFALAMAVDYVLHDKVRSVRENVKKWFAFFIFVCVILMIPKATDKITDTFFRVEGAESESIWTQFWMGINEEEFGFMHNEIYDGQKDFNDFYTLLTSRSVKQNIHLFGRKIFWTWTQGTYQAQRYGFGNDAEQSSDKFDYETAATKYLCKDIQRGRKIVNLVCRAQYLALFFFMTVGLFSMEQEREAYRIFLYVMVLTFMILVFYEMKSRYILHCIIPMMMYALRGLRLSDRMS